MKSSTVAQPRLVNRLEFEALQALPCGCVAASFRAMPWAVEFVRLEAKGPHCFHLDHASGSILSLDAETDDDIDIPELQ